MDSTLHQLNESTTFIPAGGRDPETPFQPGEIQSVTDFRFPRPTGALQDLRIGIRMLLKQPGFTLMGVLTLALGIGATAAVFSPIQGVLLTPPPYRDPERLMLLPSARTDGQKALSRGWPPAQWLEWQQQTRSFEALAA